MYRIIDNETAEQVKALMRNEPQPRYSYQGNTDVRKDKNGRVIVRLHQTDIMVFSDSDITLDAGRIWRTNTTKNRMTHVLRALGSDLHVYSDGWLSKHKTTPAWYVYVGDWGKGSRQPFFDGIKLPHGINWRKD